MSKDIDVARMHNESVAHMKDQIDIAFDQRQLHHREGGKGNTKEQMNAARSSKEKYSNLKDDEIIDFGEYIQIPGEVFVESSHDYPKFIRLAIEKLVSEGVFVDDPEWTEMVIKEVAGHEWEHAMPSLGLDNFRVYYGLRFYQIEEDGEIGFTPMIRLTGQIPAKIYREIIRAPEQLYDSDMAQL